MTPASNLRARVLFYFCFYYLWYVCRSRYNSRRLYSSQKRGTHTWYNLDNDVTHIRRLR